MKYSSVIHVTFYELTDYHVLRFTFYVSHFTYKLKNPVIDRVVYHTNAIRVYLLAILASRLILRSALAFLIRLS